MIPVLRIEHPFLSDGMGDAQSRAAKHLAAEACRDVPLSLRLPYAKKVSEVVFAGLYDPLRLSAKLRDITNTCLRHADRYRCAATTSPWPANASTACFVALFTSAERLVAVVESAYFDGFLGGISKCHHLRRRPCG